MNAFVPIILPEKQEQFVQQYLMGKTQTEAYKIAYGASQKAAEANSARLIRSDKVIARIEQVRRHEAAARRVTLPFLTEGLLTAAADARALGQPGAAVAAWMGVAKLHGMIIDRTQVDAVVRRPSSEPTSPDEMSEEQWLASHSIGIVEHSITLEAEPSSIDEDEPK